MRKGKILALAILITSYFFFALVSFSKPLSPQPIHFGHDKCKRCIMVIKSPYFSAEVGNPETGKVYKFDDIGCAVMWLYHDCNFSWTKKAQVWVTDAKTGKWLNAKDACWVDGMMTPMRFGLGAFKKGEVNKKCLPWEKAKELLLKRGIKKENYMKKAMPKVWEKKVRKMCVIK